MKLNVIHPVEILRQQLVVVFRPAVDILRFENRRNNAFFQKHLRRAVNAGLHKDRRGCLLYTSYKKDSFAWYKKVIATNGRDLA